MRNILFPTDFSDNAANALNNAVEMINQLGSVHLTLVHTYNIPANPTAYISFEGHLVRDAESEMNREVNRIKSMLAEGVILKNLIKRGDAIFSISKMANDYDFVIMGTQGASGLKEIFLGSITNGVIKNTITPVLTIPKGYEYKPIKNIVLSLDNDEINDQKGIQIIKDLIKFFKADLMLFHTEEQAADKGFDRNVTKIFNNAGFSIDFNFTGKNINASIEDMVIDYDVDLLCMVRRKRGLLDKLFHQSVTSKEVFHSKIPLLILHDV